MPGYLSGKTGYVQLGATPYTFGKWKCPMKANPVKVNNFTSQGFRQIVIGFIEGDITCSGPYFAGGMPLVAGQEYTFHLGWELGLEIVITAKITNLEPDNDAEGTPMVNITAQSNGVFTAAIA